MTRPLEGDSDLKLFKFDDAEGRDTFWHSSAHILGQSLEMEYGCKLCIGPCTTRGEGFYYDAFYDELTLNEEHFKQIQSRASKAVGLTNHIFHYLGMDHDRKKDAIIDCWQELILVVLLLKFLRPDFPSEKFLFSVPILHC
ncbi:hypothetical protein B296_00052581 [Ensete ventricosum]|uniref:TGS domain-containing protein n=1 Tax=Ensete ventricosum TaxID=4639 RepID=A0A426YBS0_ENSVE|nr:hypothetical protein B296_00052581 [Ensete ventricosum]